MTSQQLIEAVETQLACSTCKVVADCGYIKLPCDHYLCAECCRHCTKYHLRQTVPMSEVLVSLGTEGFPCPECREHCPVDPNLTTGSKRADSKFLFLRELYQQWTASKDYLRCTCGSLHGNDNEWIHCPSRTTPCTWCEMPLRLSPSDRVVATNQMLIHLRTECTHYFECLHCNIVDIRTGQWRLLKFKYTEFLAHAEAHRACHQWIKSTRMMWRSSIPSGCDQRTPVKFWLNNMLTYLSLHDVIASHRMFCDEASSSEPRTTIITAYLNGGFQGMITPMLESNFYQMISHPKWSRGESSDIDALPDMIKVLYRDIEPVPRSPPPASELPLPGFAVRTISVRIDIPGSERQETVFPLAHETLFQMLQEDDTEERDERDEQGSSDESENNDELSHSRVSSVRSADSASSGDSDISNSPVQTDPVYIMQISDDPPVAIALRTDEYERLHMLGQQDLDRRNSNAEIRLSDDDNLFLQQLDQLEQGQGQRYWQHLPE